MHQRQPVDDCHIFRSCFGRFSDLTNRDRIRTVLLGILQAGMVRANTRLRI
jgi:hypothetical protein